MELTKIEKAPVVKVKKDCQIEDFLRTEFLPPKGTTLDIRKICDNTYRLNFWGKHVLHLGKSESNGILHSIWVVVKPTKNGFEVIEKDSN
jgi:hypothetical protein